MFRIRLTFYMLLFHYTAGLALFPLLGGYLEYRRGNFAKNLFAGMRDFISYAADRARNAIGEINTGRVLEWIVLFVAAFLISFIFSAAIGRGYSRVLNRTEGLRLGDYSIRLGGKGVFSKLCLSLDKLSAELEQKERERRSEALEARVCAEDSLKRVRILLAESLGKAGALRECAVFPEGSHEMKLILDMMQDIDRSSRIIDEHLMRLNSADNR